jgi:hypothetical protein
MLAYASIAEARVTLPGGDRFVTARGRARSVALGHDENPAAKWR